MILKGIEEKGERADLNGLRPQGPPDLTHNFASGSSQILTANSSQPHPHSQPYFYSMECFQVALTVFCCACRNAVGAWIKEAVLRGQWLRVAWPGSAWSSMSIPIPWALLWKPIPFPQEIIIATKPLWESPEEMATGPIPKGISMEVTSPWRFPQQWAS